MTNVLNCIVHMFLFQSISQKVLFDLLRHLLQSFHEADIEVLIFLLHNIGLQLRKADPLALRDLLALADQKRNSFQAVLKMDPTEELHRLERKVGFLSLELQDIRNNKGTLTLQVKSVEHLQTWLKKSPQLMQSELLIQPLDVTLESF